MAPVPIDYGAKITGKIGHDCGLQLPEHMADGGVIVDNLRIGSQTSEVSIYGDCEAEEFTP